MALYGVYMLITRLPLIIKTTIYHKLAWSRESHVWDLSTALIVAVVRSILSSTSSTVSRAQSFMLQAAPPRGPIWVSRVKLPCPPEEDLKRLVLDSIDNLKESQDQAYTVPSMLPVEAEWNGLQHGAPIGQPEPTDLSEAEKYKRLTDEVGSDLTMLYIHGGAFYLMDPATHRLMVWRLCRLSKGRAFNIRYRLAPQNPFPAAMLDCLIAYLSLLYPPEGSFHDPVKPEHIVFAGDSAGANMCMVLVLFILHLKRIGQATVKWHGRDVELPLPAAAALNSAWVDLARSLPSLQRNAHYDYLPPLPPIRKPGDPFRPHPPPCPIWPASPPRPDYYANGNMLCHPLVSPLAAAAGMWRGAPPMFICSGEEMLEDEMRVVAQRLHSVGVPLKYELYEAMPHCFAPVLDGRTPRTQRCYEGWATFMCKAVETASARIRAGKSGAPTADEVPELTGGSWIAHRSGEEADIDLNSLTSLTDDEVANYMRDARDRIIGDFEEEFGVQADSMNGHSNGHSKKD